jgi:hypothetical protein
VRPGNCSCSSTLPRTTKLGFQMVAVHERQFTEGRQIQAGCTCPENRAGLKPGSEHYRRLPPNLNHQPKLNTMKPILRYQSQLLFRKSYKPNRTIRIRPAPKVNVAFHRERRFGIKPRVEIVW